MLRLKNLFYAFLLTCSLKGQIPDFRHYTSRDGLLSDNAYNMFCDRSGYLWVFSEFGTLKYDGYTFRKVLSNLPFRESFIYTMFERPDGRKWVANSMARIYEIRNDSAFLVPGFEAQSKLLRDNVSEIASLVVADNLDIYVQTKAECFVLRRKASSYLAEDLNADVPRDSILVRSLMVGDKFTFIPVRSKNDEFVDNNLRRRNKLQLPDGRVLPLAYSAGITGIRALRKYQDDYFFTFSHSLAVVRKNREIKYIDVGAIVLSYEKDSRGHLWVGCLGAGLFELNEKDSIVNHYLNQLTVNHIVIDKQGGIWSSTAGDGVFRLSSMRMWHYEADHPLGASLTLFKKINQQIFIANQSGQIYEGSFLNFRKIREADQEAVYSMATAGQSFYFGLGHSFEKTTGGNYQFKKLSYSPKFYELHYTGGDTIIAAWRRGFEFFVGDVCVKRIDFGKKILCSALFNGLIWCGTEDGVYVYPRTFKVAGKRELGVVIPDKEAFADSPELKLLKGKVVVKIRADGYGNLYFCTWGNGIYKLTAGGGVQSLFEKDFSEKVINDVCFLDDARVVIAANSGLFLIKKTGSITQTSRLYPGEVKAVEYLEGNAYLQTNTGLVVINQPGMLDRQQEGIYFRIRSISLDTLEQLPVNELIVPAGTNNLRFTYDLVNFENEVPALMYRLIGPVQDSGLIKNRQVRFNTLLPGSYTIEAWPDLQNARSLSSNLVFVIKPQFYQTIWFRAFALALLVVFVVILSWLVFKISRRRREEKLKVEQVIEEYKLIALKAQINPHFMSNCLTAIQNMIVEGRTREANLYIARFGLLVRRILDYSARNFITLAEELELLKIYVELEQLRFHNMFTFDLDVDAAVKSEDILVPPLFLNPIVENAIWHGLLPLKGREARLLVSIWNNAEKLVLLVKDNGVGRSEKKAHSLIKKESLGMKITEQRVRNFSFLTKKEGSLEYQDMFDDNGKPAGTIVKLVLPVYTDD